MALESASPYNNERPDGDLDTQGDEQGTENQESTPGTARTRIAALALSLARDSWDTAETWFDAAVRRDLERNVAHFQGRHAPGSKYYSAQYKHRAKGFRPKSRTIVRKNEALAANAFFATSNVLSIKAQNSGNIVERVSAEINKGLLEYRFNNTLPWYETVVGAYQDTLVNGPCISHQYWDYQEAVRSVPVYGEDGKEVLDEEGNVEFEEQVEVIKDGPDVDLRPLENVRFSPSANWRDPINSSPFLIDRIALTIEEVIAMSTQVGGKSRIPWVEQTVDSLRAGIGASESDSDDSVRRQRERSQLDPVSENSYLHQEFDTIWIHRNIVRYENQDWIYYTLGTEKLLSEPIPLEEEYPHLLPGERPYVMGYSVLETHKTYPQSITGITSGLQQSANELSNQRQDNVALVLNKRYYVKRGQGVDLKALQRNVPGGVVLTNNVDMDVRSESPADVTSSSYQEQDRINADFDDVSGNFSVASVGTNRQLNETVGGMELMSGDADIITEYQLRTFSKTWAEVVLRQLVRLEQRHETDEAILATIGEDLNLWQRFGISEIEDDMLQGSMTLKVNVGFGATNPSQRINRMATGLNTVRNFAPKMASRINEEEVVKEVFGAIGFDDGSRFFVPELPEEEQPQPQPDPQIVLEQLRGQNALQLEQIRFENEMQLEQVRTQNEIRKDDVDLQKDMSAKAMTTAIEERKLEAAERDSLRKEQNDAAKQRNNLAQTAIKERGDRERFNAELDIKRRTGKGI